APARAAAGAARRPARAGRRDPRGARRGRARAGEDRPGPARRARLATGAGMSPAEADALLFGDSLACEVLRPAALLPRPRDPGPALAASGGALLPALAGLEAGARREVRQRDDHALARVEARLDRLTVLVAGLVRQEDGGPVRRL